MRTLLLACLLLPLSSCYKIDYVNGGQQQGDPTDFWRHRMVFGIVEAGGPLQLQEICPGGVSHIHTEISLPNGAVTQVLNAITGLGWVYRPSTIQIWCKSGEVFLAPAQGNEALVQTNHTGAVEYR